MPGRPFQLAGDGLSHSTPPAHQAIFAHPQSAPSNTPKMEALPACWNPAFVTLVSSLAVCTPPMLLHTLVLPGLEMKATLARMESALATQADGRRTCISAEAPSQTRDGGIVRALQRTDRRAGGLEGRTMWYRVRVTQCWTILYNTPAPPEYHGSLL
ncbi:MAG: hypothetical protein M1840_008322 [Geoglossum simile]|nr:MAG: hypothetical protein M1840_008322 [Geoglossum simile]